MAYSDYGGFAYKNGIKVLDRSDVAFNAGDLKSSPGSWPGWYFPEDQIGQSCHVILGDGPIYVGLYKQTHIFVWNKGIEVALIDFFANEDVRIDEYGGIDIDSYRDAETPAIFEINGHKIEIYWLETDNYYQFIRLTQPDGVEWTGFSGYGVGAGLESGAHGFDTDSVEAKLFELF